MYGHSFGGRCGDRRTASHEYEVQTLLTFHFMAISVAWDARPEKKVKFSALFAQKTPQIGRLLMICHILCILITA